jgi:hypothetical protein
MEVFSKANAETLPPHRSFDYEIDLSPATICHMSGFTASRSWVERYSPNCVHYDHVLTRPDHRFGFVLNDPMPYGQINEWAFSNDGQYVTGWIMGLR